jgi:hypothetical protein
MKKGMVVRQKYEAPQAAGRPVYFDDFDGSTRVFRDGTVGGSTMFYVPDRDFVGVVTLQNSAHYPIKLVRKRPDGSVQLDLAFIDAVLIGPAMDVPYQPIGLIKDSETKINSISAVIKDAQVTYESGILPTFLTQGPGEEQESVPLGLAGSWFNGNGAPFILGSKSQFHFGWTPATTVQVMHTIENVPADLFASVRGGGYGLIGGIASSLLHGNKGIQEAAAYAGPKSVYYSEALGDSYEVAYSRVASVVSTHGAHNPFQFMLNNPKEDDSVRTQVVLPDESKKLLKALREMEGPTHIRWSGDSAFRMAEEGFIMPNPSNTFLLPAPVFFHSATAASLGESSLGGLTKDVMFARLREARDFTVVAALLAADTYTADVEVYVGHQLADTIKTPGRAIPEDLPFSVFTSQGLKVRDFKEKVLTDDDYLF